MEMSSLPQLTKFDEHGVNFKLPYDESQRILALEHSTHIQNPIGIIMQLRRCDDNDNC